MQNDLFKQFYLFIIFYYYIIKQDRERIYCNTIITRDVTKGLKKCFYLLLKYMLKL